jgi:hypothetical protein
LGVLNPTTLIYLLWWPHLSPHQIITRHFLVSRLRIARHNTKSAVCTTPQPYYSAFLSDLSKRSFELSYNFLSDRRWVIVFQTSFVSQRIILRFGSAKCLFLLANA